MTDQRAAMRGLFVALGLAILLSGGIASPAPAKKHSDTLRYAYVPGRSWHPLQDEARRYHCGFRRRASSSGVGS
jgi:hypothetical protein